MKDPIITMLETLIHTLDSHPEMIPHLEPLVYSRGSWAKRMFDAPSPDSVKRTVILRNGLRNSTWVETGTYRGDTTAELARIAKKVYTIEPQQQLFADAKVRFSQLGNVEALNGGSEDIFPTLLPTMEGDICFWLDGHYSGEGTFKGPNDTPIHFELRSIEENLYHFDSVRVLIDDIRLFNGKIHAYGDYPTLDYLVDWSRKNRLEWHIEHDIFIAKR